MNKFVEMNIRRHRAKHMAAAVMQEIKDFIPGETLPDVHDALIKCFDRNGLSLINDEERAHLGLEPRDDNGWTPSERLQSERAYLDAMLAMSQQIIIAKPKPTTA